APAASSANGPPAIILKGPYNVWSDALSWFRQFLRHATVVAAHHARQRTAHRAHAQQMPAVGETAAAAPHADERNCPAAVPTHNPGCIRHSPELPMTHTAEYKLGEQDGARKCEQDRVQDEVIQLALRGCVYTQFP